MVNDSVTKAITFLNIILPPYKIFITLYEDVFIHVFVKAKE